MLKKLTIFTCIFIELIFVCNAQEVRSFEPIISVVTGTLINENRYGAPGYGEDPNVDIVNVVPFINLDTNIDVIGKSSGEYEIKTYKNIGKMQVIGKSNFELRNLIGKHVEITGKLYEKDNAEHYTDVIIYAQKIEIK